MAMPMRVIEGTAQPHTAFWRILDAAESESGEAEVEFNGPISEYSWWGDEITPKMFKDELHAKGKGGPVTVKINSPGGEVIAASVIRSILQDYPGRVTADIVGLAASAATIVVTGADVVRMRESALMMIHDPSSIAWGTIDEIKKCLEVLKTVKDVIISVYQAKTGMDPAKLGKMMSSETWMTAQQAKEWGFVDEISAGSAKPMMGFANCLQQYVHVPASLAEQVQNEVMTAEKPASAGEQADNEDAEAEALRERVQLILKGKNP